MTRNEMNQHSVRRRVFSGCEGRGATSLVGPAWLGPSTLTQLCGKDGSLKDSHLLCRHSLQSTKWLWSQDRWSIAKSKYSPPSGYLHGNTEPSFCGKHELRWEATLTGAPQTSVSETPRTKALLSATLHQVNLYCVEEYALSLARFHLISRMRGRLVLLSVYCFTRCGLQRCR